ncbi:uncharacterized protein LOC126783979 [Argentina anserina]|uniref:uncharacterized protein LOC126783979 n=1 Tax=Argentina anserina TaxID=57926 RepID=UPI0021762613|nr:uncharacterized protein LOC126783979 [Potentilla anserina]
MVSKAMKSSKGSRFIRFMKAPIRVLIKARDFYIKSMAECSTRLDYGGMAMGCPTAQVPSALPRSFSTSSVDSSSSRNNDDYRELMRAASARSTLAYSKNMEDLGRKQQIHSTTGGNNEMMNRSRSVGIGRIDEDKACEFGEDVKVNKNMFPRSRSSAIARRTTF